MATTAPPSTGSPLQMQLLSHSVVAFGAFVLGSLCNHCQREQDQQDPCGREISASGHACIDVVMEQCEELSSREGYAAVERFKLTPGGAVSNMAMQMSSLGVTVEAMTVLGNDDFGRLLREAWKRAGIRADRFVQLTDDAPTSCAALPVYKSDSKRAVYACPGSNATINGEMLLPRAPGGGPDYAMLSSYKFFVLGYPHIMPKLQGSSLRAFLMAVAQHCAVALDVNEAFDHPQLPLGRPAGTDEKPFAPIAVLHCNLEEAAACLNRKAELMATAAAASGVSAAEVNLENWVERAEVESLGSDLLDAGCGIVVITLGAHGCYGASADETRLRKLLGNAYPTHPPQTRPSFAGQRVFIPAFACEGAVNSVGAGDSFLAGVVAALCHYSAPTSEAPLDLAHLLTIGAASSCFKVDSAKSSCPALPILLKRMGELKILTSGDSARLL